MITGISPWEVLLYGLVFVFLYCALGIATVIIAGLLREIAKRGKE